MVKEEIPFGSEDVRTSRWDPAIVAHSLRGYYNNLWQSGLGKIPFRLNGVGMANGFRVIAFTRDRHSADHASFAAKGGVWPVHCVDGTPGFQFHPDLLPPANAVIIDKGTTNAGEGFDGFEGTALLETLRGHRVNRVFVVGLATEYCVRATTLSAIRAGFETWLVVDAVAPVEKQPGDGNRALLEMRDAGANFASAGQVTVLLDHQPHPSALIAVDLQVDFFPGGALPVASAPLIIPPIQVLLHHATTSAKKKKHHEAHP